MIRSFKIPKRFSFRTRLFMVMIGMLVIAGLMILGSTTIQYESQRENYHLGRLARKESQIQSKEIIVKSAKMNHISSFRTPKRSPKRAPKKTHKTKQSTDFQGVGVTGEVTPDSRSTGDVPSIMRTNTATRHERGLSSEPYTTDLLKNLTLS